MGIVHNAKFGCRLVLSNDTVMREVMYLMTILDVLGLSESFDDSSVQLTQNHMIILFELFGFEFESLQQGQ